MDPWTAVDLWTAADLSMDPTTGIEGSTPDASMASAVERSMRSMAGAGGVAGDSWGLLGSPRDS